MTLDLTCRPCRGTGEEWGASTPWVGGWNMPTRKIPCARCDGAGVLHAHQIALDVARAHGTGVAVEFTGVSDKTIVRLRKVHDDYDRGRGRPSRAEMAAMSPRLDCDCFRCIDHRSTLVANANKLLGKLRTSGEADRSWQARRNCIGVDPELFFPERGESLAPARSVCAGCEVRAECLDYALNTGQHHGVWGGTSERERKRTRRRRRTGSAA